MKNLSKIAFILGPLSKEGGVTTFVEEVTYILLKKGFCVCILTFTKNQHVSKFILDLKSDKLEILYLPKNINKFFSYININKEDIVISNLYYSFLLAFFKSATKIHILHGFGKLESGILKFLIGNISNIIGNIFADKVISNSYLTSSVNRVLGIKKSHVTPWGIPKIFEVPAIKTYSDRDIDLLYVGRIRSEKRIELIIQAFQQVLEISDKKLCLHIVGDLKESLHFDKSLNDNIITNNVIYHGFLNKNEIIEVYSRSKLFISLNPDEPLGFTYLESLSCGTPIIIPKGSGIAPFVNKKMAICVDINKDSVTNAIKQGLSTSWDVEEIAALARNTFNWQKTARILLGE